VKMSLGKQTSDESNKDAALADAPKGERIVKAKATKSFIL